MASKLILFGLFMLAASSCAAQVLKASIISSPSRVLPYEPVTIVMEVENLIAKPLTLAFGYHGFTISLSATTPDGKIVGGCLDVQIKPAAGYRLETRPAHWKETVTRPPVCWPAAEGTYIVQAVVSSSGPYRQVNGDEVQAWSGVEKSSVVTIEIVPATGIDKQVLDYFHGDPLGHPKDLLGRFPTSTYAGYALLKKGQGGSLQEASVLTDAVRDSIWHVPPVATKEQQEERRRQAREGCASFIRMARPFLAAHPDFAQEALLRKALAISYFFAGKPQEAWLEVEALAKLQGEWAEEGRKVLENRKRQAELSASTPSTKPTTPTPSKPPTNKPPTDGD
jgi:hypothetical protein